MSDPSKELRENIPAEPGTLRKVNTAIRKLVPDDKTKRYRLPDGIVSVTANTQSSSDPSLGSIEVTRYQQIGRHGKFDQRTGVEVFRHVEFITAVVGDDVTSGSFFEGESPNNFDRFSDLDERHKLQPATEEQAQSVLIKIAALNEDNEINIFDRTKAEQESDRQTADEIRNLIKQALDIAKGVDKHTIRGDGAEEATFRKGEVQLVFTRDPSSGAGFVQIINGNAMIEDGDDPAWVVSPTEVVGVLGSDSEDQRLDYLVLQDKRRRDGTETIADPQRREQNRPRAVKLPQEDEVQRIKDLLDLSEAQLI